MCTTTQFFFACNHAASDAFRDGVCSRPDIPTCYRDHPRVVTLPNLCIRCTHTYDSMSRSEQSDVMKSEFGRRYTQALKNEAPMNHIWQIPSRCFVDPGFHRHNPFAADKIKQEVEAFENGRSSRIWGMPRPLEIRKHSTCAKPVSVYRRAPPMVYRMPLAPCCEGTMIRCWQGLKKLATGRHIDNRCRSGF